MDERGVEIVSPRFPLDEDVVPESPTYRVQYANHGRAVARNSAGQWFCALTFDRRYRDRTWLALAVSRGREGCGGEFHPPLLLAGRADAPWHFPVFDLGEGLIGNSCVLIDGRDRLHVLFDHPTGVFRVTAEATPGAEAGRLARAEAWSGPHRVAAAGTRLGDATFLPDGRMACYLLRDGTLLERVEDGPESLISADGDRPSVHIEDNGARHVAFERRRRVFYARSGDGRTWTDSRGRAEPELVAYFCSAWPSVAVDAGGRVVIAWQGEGKVDLRRAPLLYRQVRGAGGTTVSYAVLGGEGWRVRDFLRSSEIVMKRKPCSSFATREEGFAAVMEEFWRPSLSVDRHGVVWMFYLNPTRRHLFFTRFEGERFGTHYEARGPYDCLSRNFFLQKDARRSDAIGALTHAGHRLYFDAVPVAELRAEAGRRVVFLDNLEVAECIGVEHRPGGWRKDPARLFGASVSGESGDDHVGWCHVLPVEGGYEMRYMGMESLYSNSLPGRAFSRDGVNWEKRPVFDRVKMTLDGKPFRDPFWRPIYLPDPSERDPAMRFKGLQQSYREVRGIEARTWDVVASADEMNWRRVPGLAPVALGDISVGFHLIRDEADADPRRRYKASMLIGCVAGRNPVIYTSPDLLHWHGVYNLREDPDRIDSPLSPWQTGPIVLDPDAAESPWEEEIHDAILWRENGLLMYHYDAFYFGSNQHINKALAVSRDGKRYWRVQRGAFNLRHGACGEWDNGRVRTSPPFRVGEEYWLYFAGMPAGNFADADRDDPASVRAAAPSPEDNRRNRELRPWSVGRARMRVDGWAYLRLDPDGDDGRMTTVPFDYAGGALVVNGSGLGEGGIRVELLTPDGRPVAGHERTQCRFSSPDAISAKVSWPGAPAPANGRYRLRFHFEGVKAKLYGFGFE
jgi:hypothetical protein